MTQEEKSLLLKDLCARLPYKLWIHFEYDSNSTTIDEDRFLDFEDVETLKYNVEHPESEGYARISWKPYLRPMSYMTEGERKGLKKNTCPDGTGTFDEKYLICPMSHYGEHISYEFMSDILSWLNEHHFDYRGLIEKGLALEAPKGMYN